MISRRSTRTPKPAPQQDLEAQVFLNVMKTADALARGAEAVLKPAGLSGTQYNVLRILRGAGEHGLACSEVGERLISRDPDMTRLLDRMESRGLIARAREEKDRRVVKTRITPEGLRILAELDDPVRELHRRQLQPPARQAAAAAVRNYWNAHAGKRIREIAGSKFLRPDLIAAFDPMRFHKKEKRS